MTRHCSFCFQPNHTIRTCNDDRIDFWWQALMSFTFTIYYEDGFVTDRYIKNYIVSIPTNIMMAISIKKTESRLREAMDVHIYRLTHRIRDEIRRFTLLSPDDKYTYLCRNCPSIVEELYGMMHDLEEIETPKQTPIEPIMCCLESREELATLVECAICYSEKSLLNFDTTNCNHQFCHTCIMKQIEINRSCPLCRTKIKSLEIKDVENFNDASSKFQRVPVIEETPF